MMNSGTPLFGNLLHYGSENRDSRRLHFQDKTIWKTLQKLGTSNICGQSADMDKCPQKMGKHGRGFLEQMDFFHGSTPRLWPQIPSVTGNIHLRFHSLYIEWSNGQMHPS